MFELKGKKTVVGVDLGSRLTKIVRLNFAQARSQIDLCETIPTGLLDQDFDRQLREHLKRLRLAGAVVASSIDDPSMKIRKVEVPKMPDADLIEAVKWSLRDIVDDDVEKYFITHSLIREFEEGDAHKLDLVAYAIKKEAVAAYQNLLEKLGLSPVFIEPASVSLASTLERCLGTLDEYSAGVNIGYHQSLFVIIGKGIFVFSRPLPGIHLQAYETEPGSFFQKLALEIQKSLDTFRVNFKMEDVKSLHVSGGGALLEGLIDYLNTNLGLSTQQLNPLKGFAANQDFDMSQGPLFAQAVGLAHITA
jgi:MSHA biogenesis protein MshI